ncbi:MAG: mechanosensitive ion channel domain-containing protein [Gemmatimonadota bacterium]
MSDFFQNIGAGLNQHLFDIGGVPITAATVISSLLIVLLSLVVARLVRRAMIRFSRSRSVAQAGSVAVSAKLIQYLIIGLGVAIAVQNAGINLTAVFAAGAVFAVAIGFAMQNITANFVSGIILLFERSVKPGDVVRVNDQFGTIKELGIRATIVRGLDEEDLIVPNSELVQSTVINYTFGDALYRLHVPVGVSYDSDMKQVRAVLEAVARGMSWRTKAKDPVVFMSAFADSAVNFDVLVWTENPWNRGQLRSDLHEAIWFALKDADITIAYPQLDVHLGQAPPDPGGS